MRNWDETCRNDGAVMACDFVICNEAPDDEAIDACKGFGQSVSIDFLHLILPETGNSNTFNMPECVDSIPVYFFLLQQNLYFRTLHI